MYVRVRVVAGARKELVKKVSDTEFALSVREPAERNLANRRVQAVLAEIYEVPVRDVRITAGHRSPTKIFDIIKK
ncbi:DUF167 domain-containing protein [Candidatus Parcubacteria bacterium]|uniref:Uncharacterized protein n=1 Tax=Candidatus Kaiserbacteria bacterium CG10_big_fil_rev_8_21_14_0_10_47_16 TaxID=1974608 RepID=A0A2H0UD27_9BACT|nr:DUF167 domain-containing protein [Candidatus Parcubacteria bacterium]PIR84297.1 MAG: hypothetical protein COU16_01730 [Candidatus Kaiserbacteria bacterium CG10_big_fil_rev_8_21_14_0_10_47_16]